MLALRKGRIHNNLLDAIRIAEGTLDTQEYYFEGCRQAGSYLRPAWRRSLGRVVGLPET